MAIIAMKEAQWEESALGVLGKPQIARVESAKLAMKLGMGQKRVFSSVQGSSQSGLRSICRDSVGF